MAERFVARPSPGRLALLILASLGFVALGAWIAGAFGPPPAPGKVWIGYLAAGFFGLCALVLFRRLFDRDDQIVVDDQGVAWKQWSERTIPWLAIKAIERRSVRGEQFICLTLDDPSRYAPGGMLGGMSRFNRMFAFGDVAITTRGTDKSIDELIAAIERFSPKGPRAPQLRLDG
jgi:hypothetical protein